MRTVIASRHFVPIATTLALLAGCALPLNSPTGRDDGLPFIAPGATQQSMAPSSRDRRNLLYVSYAFNYGDFVRVYTFGRQRWVGELRPFSPIFGMCADRGGYVFVLGLQEIAKYAHGLKDPVARIEDDLEPQECAVDSTTGDLAVTNAGVGHGGSVSIYKRARGKPKVYKINDVPYPLWVTYDSQGDLIADGDKNRSPAFAELHKGEKRFNRLFLPLPLTSAGYVPATLQWVGTYLTLGVHWGADVFRVSISGNEGRVANIIHLKDCAPADTFIFQGKLLAVCPEKGIFVYRYPAGGAPVRILRKILAGLQTSAVISN